MEANKKLQLHLQKSQYLIINSKGNESNQSVGIKFMHQKVVDKCRQDFLNIKSKFLLKVWLLRLQGERFDMLEHVKKWLIELFSKDIHTGGLDITNIVY